MKSGMYRSIASRRSQKYSNAQQSMHLCFARCRLFIAAWRFGPQIYSAVNVQFAITPTLQDLSLLSSGPLIYLSAGFEVGP